jgi:hydrogenase expression/formation protein HypE
VPVVTGDTKVVEQGKGDGVYITTTGVGVVAEGAGLVRRPRPPRRPDPRFRQHRRPRHGDHGAAREPRLRRAIVSDTAALHGLIAAMRASGAAIRVLRDPTRGGVATTLNEIARQSGVGMMLQEARCR